MIKLLDILNEIRITPVPGNFKEGDWIDHFKKLKLGNGEYYNIEIQGPIIDIEFFEDYVQFTIDNRLRRGRGDTKIDKRYIAYFFNPQTEIDEMGNEDFKKIKKIKPPSNLQEIKITPFSQDFLDACAKKDTEPSTEYNSGLNLSHTGLKTLPVNIKLGGGLNIGYTQVSYLPPSIKKINGSLDISGTKITKLPQFLKIRDSLYLNDMTLTEKISDNVKVGFRVYTNNSINAWFLNDELRRKLTMR